MNEGTVMGRRGQCWEGRDVMGRRGQWWEEGGSDGKEGTVVGRREQ